MLQAYTNLPYIPPSASLAVLSLEKRLTGDSPLRSNKHLGQQLIGQSALMLLCDDRGMGRTSAQEPSDMSVARDSTVWYLLNRLINRVEPPFGFV